MSEQLGSLAWGGFKLTFGLVSLAGAWTLAVVKNGALWAKDSEEEKRELAAAQERFWSLDREPLPGFRHAFFETSRGKKVHYVVHDGPESGKAKNVAIFIHGFPDSFLIWRHLLQSPSLQQDTILVAVDLPGYGGSDGLPTYSPNEMLEAVSEFIINIRQQFLQEDKKTVVVTHDWGAVIGARLASEAHVLADHWIITGGVIPGLQRSNAQNRILLAKQMLHTWVSSPLNTRLLKNGINALGPVASQFRRSFYIFVFHLPQPLNRVFATFGNYWFLRILHSLGKGPRGKARSSTTVLDPVEAAESMAISTGPARPQLDTKAPQTGYGYSDDIQSRIADRGMAEKIRIYRENLVFGKWDKSLEITAALYNISSSASDMYSSSSSGALANTAPEGALKAPATLIMGQYEPAFDQRLALDNARDYLVKGSQVVIVKGAGHW
ncbi:catalytic hydrolase [Stemphylium lycopersici]|uniref:Catalytic hydrolase n=1 Tax=Stemphylium lycopersici TaxID=183478 RepID=A0A364NFH6_STELY|nr:catalytic hydrolase [Stemphylium lycopersici]RAR16074.1 catalytic hydrolase [Stemphylium lycopersici]